MRVLAAVLGACWLCVAVVPAAPPFRISLSVSPFTETVLKSGVQFTDGTNTATTTEGLQRLFVNHGANEVYARISTRVSLVRGAGDHTMNRGLERARLGASLHLPFNPELGLFGSYGDIRCQPPPDFSDYPAIVLPGPWPSLNLEQQLRALRSYGAAAATAIVASGVTVGIWDLGNEVEFGVAGVAVRPMPGGCDVSAGATAAYQAPDGVDSAIGSMSAIRLTQMDPPQRISWLRAHIWAYEAKMFDAVASGIRTVDAHARFSTHVSGVASTQPAFAAAFFAAMRDGGFPVDEAGVSYYPTSSSYPADRLKAFKDTAVAIKTAIGRPVFVAEFGYPSATMGKVFPWNDAVSGYPLTPEGQAQFIRDLITWGKREGVLSGIRPWAPDLAMPGWAPMALFVRQGPLANARPALDAFAR